MDKTITPTQLREHFRFLEVELDRTKRHLAEVIDEVVFAEKCKRDAEDKLHEHQQETAAIEHILQDLIGYLIAIENAVIVPAIDEVAEAIPAGTVAERAQLFTDLEKLHHVSARTIRLVASMKNPSKANRDRFHMRRDQLLRQSDKPVSLDDAYALCALLLDAKEELQLLVADSRDRAMSLSGAGTRMSQSVAARAPSAQPSAQTQQMVEELRKQVDSVRLELEGSRKEKEMLNKRLNELTVSQAQPYDQLQQQHYREKERLQMQVRSLQESEKAVSEKHQFVAGKLEVLQETIQQLQEEKKLLQNEVKSYRKNEGVEGQQTSALQHQLRQSNDDAQRLRLEIDTLIREHSNTVTRLESQVSHLRLELAETKLINRPANNEHFAQLQRTNDLLRKDLVVLQQKLLSSAGRSPVEASNSSFDAKVQAFEMTIKSLNSELAQLERKINAQEAAFAHERASLIGEMDRERLKFQRDKEDYDMLMQKMVDEMDQIVKENRTLKERLVSIMK